jgi:hypothetical protein
MSSGLPQQGRSKTRRKQRETPIVDSTLLRFLSTQKQTPDTFLIPDTSLLPKENYQLPKQQDRIQQQQQQEEEPPNEPFNYYKHVAQTLLAMGDNAAISKETALQAGESVQRHVLARTAQRRLRLFLKQRDTQLWAPEENTTPLSSSSACAPVDKEENQLDGTFDYFEQVIEVLVEQGLTANDISTILTHTPSVALMRPRNGQNTLERTCHRVIRDLLSESLQLRKYDARKVRCLACVWHARTILYYIQWIANPFLLTHIYTHTHYLIIIMFI